MIGWIDTLLEEQEVQELHYSTSFDRAKRRVSALNRAPTDVGRGLSETLSIPSDQLQAEEWNVLDYIKDFQTALEGDMSGCQKN